MLSIFKSVNIFDIVFDFFTPYGSSDSLTFTIEISKTYDKIF